jgi:hypothetical protein
MILREALSLVWTSAVGLLCLSMALASRDMPMQAGQFPRFAGWAGFLLAVGLLVQQAVTLRRDGQSLREVTTSLDDPDDVAVAGAPVDVAEPETEYTHLRAVRFLVWLYVYAGAVYLIGLIVASALFVGTFLLIEGRVKWYWALVGMFVPVVGIFALQEILTLPWPSSVLGWPQ